MADDIVTRLRACWCHDAFRDRGRVDPGCDHDGLRSEAADEIERLRSERLDWFLVARELRDALWTEQYGAALDSYLRIRGSLEDPRDIDQAVRGE